MLFRRQPPHAAQPALARALDANACGDLVDDPAQRLLLLVALRQVLLVLVVRLETAADRAAATSCAEAAKRSRIILIPVRGPDRRLISQHQNFDHGRNSKKESWRK